MTNENKFSQKVQVLVPCRQLIKVLDAFVKEIDWRVASFEALQKFIIFVIILFGTCLTIILYIWFCFDNAFNLVKISLAMTSLITDIVSLLLFVLMSKNKNFMGETIDFLQNNVEERKY